MKRFAVAGATIILTTGLALFAIALAQRDSRESESMLHDETPPYANQTPEPLLLALGPESLTPEDPRPVPKNILRTISTIPNDGFIAEETLSSGSGFEEPPAFPKVEQTLAFESPGESSELVQASGEQPLNSNGQTAPPKPRLLTAPAPAPAPVQGVSPAPNSPPLFSAPPSLSPTPRSGNLQPPPTGQVPNTTSSSQAASNTPASAGATTFGVTSPYTAATQPIPTSQPGQPPMNSAPSMASSPANTVLASPPMASAMPSSPGFPSSSPSVLPNSTPPSFSANQPPLSPARSPVSLAAPRTPPVPSEAPNPTPRDLPRSPLGTSASYASTNSKVQASLVSAAPGNRQMDGAQTPSLKFQKKAPEEVQVGQPATFAMTVRNVGNATAYDVSVVDSVPRGTRLSKTSPPAEHRADGTLIWMLGEMSAGTEQVLTVELIPETEGEIGSVASVNFAAQASVRTVSTQPKLVVKQVTEKKILVGKSIGIRVTVSNEGTGVARGVSLEEDVPRGLRHPLGSSLGVPLGDLAPGQSKSTDLELIATEPGFVQNAMRAVSANTTESISSVDIEVVAPKLQVDVTGPKLRYLERQATYQVSVVNQGTSTAYDVEITAQLPRGMQYNSSGNHGEYLSDKHIVTWALEELPVGATASTEMTLMPVEEGAFAIRMQGRAIGVESEPVEKQVQIEGQSELAFSIDDDNDPIEVDGQTTYLVRLTNNGTRLDEEVQVMIELPAGARVLQVNAPVAYKETPQGLLFEPIPQMRAKDQHQFRFSVQLSREGVQLARAHVKSRLRPNAVVKEESTEVYRDR